MGFISLQRDRSQRVADVPVRTWNFSISDFQVLYRWLAFRSERTGHMGVALDAAFYRDLLDMVARLNELIVQFDEADAVLREVIRSGALSIRMRPTLTE